MSDIFVTDVNYRMAVPALRELAARGHRVTALGYETTAKHAALGFFSKSIFQAKTLPFEETALLEALIALAAGCPQKPVLIPFGRRTLGVLSRNPRLEEHFDFIVPSPLALEQADNKHFVMKLAQKLEIPAPKTVTAEDFPSLQDMAAAMRYPCIVKYQNGETLGLKPAQRYQKAETPQALLKIYPAMAKLQARPLCQDYISGSGFGVSLLLDKESRLVDFICHRRLREFPVSGGPTACCEAIFDRRLLLAAYELLRELSFQGVAMVEFRGSLDRPYLMEINPRFWGASPLIAAADSSFYQSLWETARGTGEVLDPATCLPAYRLGQKMRFLPQDILSFFGYLARDPQKAGAFCKDLFSPGVKEGLFQGKDQAPFWHYLFHFLRGS